MGEWRPEAARIVCDAAAQAEPSRFLISTARVSKARACLPNSASPPVHLRRLTIDDPNGSIQLVFSCSAGACSRHVLWPSVIRQDSPLGYAGLPITLFSCVLPVTPVSQSGGGIQESARRRNSKATRRRMADAGLNGHGS